MRREAGRVQKNNVTLVEYDDSDSGIAGNHFVQCGVIGFFATRKELEDLSNVLNYYLNIEEFAKCKVYIEGENVSIS